MEMLVHDDAGQRLRIQLARHGPEPLVAVAGVDLALLAEPLPKADLRPFFWFLEEAPPTLEPVQKSVSEWADAPQRFDYALPRTSI